MNHSASHLGSRGELKRVRGKETFLTIDMEQKKKILCKESIVLGKVTLLSKLPSADREIPVLTG